MLGQRILFFFNFWRSKAAVYGVCIVASTIWLKLCDVIRVGPGYWVVWFVEYTSPLSPRLFIVYRVEAKGMISKTLRFIFHSRGFNLLILLLLQARVAFDKKEYQKAETYLLRAQRPELAARYYKVSLQEQLVDTQYWKEILRATNLRCSS